MSKQVLLFKVLTKSKPFIALLGTFSLAAGSHVGWYLLVAYNAGNIYVYLKRRKDFLWYAMISVCHMSFGFWAILR